MYKKKERTKEGEMNNDPEKEMLQVVSMQRWFGETTSYQKK